MHVCWCSQEGSVAGSDPAINLPKDLEGERERAAELEKELADQRAAHEASSSAAEEELLATREALSKTEAIRDKLQEQLPGLQVGIPAL